MGNTTSTRLDTQSPHWDFTASDMLLDQMEKQTSVASSPTWMEASTRYVALVLSTISALLIGILTGSLYMYQSKKKPTFVDDACQTDESFTELSVNRDWKAWDADDKVVIDDDNHSCTTETTEVLTDAESDNYEQTFNEDDFEDAADNNAENNAEHNSEYNSECVDTTPSDDLLRAICNACESCAQSDCEIQAEHLLRLTAIICTESAGVTPIVLEDYLCTCGECPQYKQIARDVAMTVKAPTRQTERITRVLQAFSTYNELRGYHIDMIPAARECLRMWCGDEDKAFQSFVTLYDEVPQLCV